LNLGEVFRRKGRFEACLAERKKSHDLGTGRAEWTYPSARFVAEAEHLVEMERRFPDHLRGASKPENVRDQVTLAEVALLSGHPLAAVRLYQSVFEKEPRSAAKLVTSIRFHG